MLLAMLTIGKWSQLKLGLVGTIQLVIVPFLLYLLVNCKGFKIDTNIVLNKGFPLLAAVLSLSTFAVMAIKTQENISLGFDIMGFHNIEVLNTPSNRLAGLLVFLSLVIYTTKSLWAKNWVIEKAKYFLIFSSLGLSFVIISRGAIVSLLLAIILMTFGQIFYDNRSKIWKTLFMVALILPIVKPFWDMFYFRMTNVKLDFSNLFRLSMWWDALMKIKAGPFIGTGPGQYLFNNFTNRTNDPHNMFLRYGVEFGGVSIIVLLILIFMPLFYLYRLKNNDGQKFKELFFIFIPPLAAALLHSQIDIIITSPSYGFAFWLFWAIFVQKVRAEEPKPTGTDENELIAKNYDN
jgi:hypothetical protein